MSKAWDKENMRTVSVNLKKEEVEALHAFAAAHDTTVGAILRLYARSLIAASGGAPRDGIPHLVSYKNTDRLKHETAFHNPNNLNPDGILNAILDDYFRFVERVRK